MLTHGAKRIIEMIAVMVEEPRCGIGINHRFVKEKALEPKRKEELTEDIEIIHQDLIIFFSSNNFQVFKCLHPTIFISFNFF
jgi:hypothetical protein